MNLAASEGSLGQLKPVNREVWIKRRPVTEVGRRIVGASVEEFAQKGILGARVAEIAHRAGTTDPTFYRYFIGIKQAALFIMSEYYWTRLNVRLAHYLEVTKDPLRLFEATVDALVQSSSDDPDYPWISESKVFQIVVAQMRNPALLPDSMMDSEYIGFLTKLENIIAIGQKEKVFKSNLRPMLLSSLLINSLNSLLVQKNIDYPIFKVDISEVQQTARLIVGIG
ncbi:MAG: TetR/AcrR family transcriptional regulator [Blastocatellia bacterium]|nr:TetR/AcrR family transcriptional regulator [Blastocatellia bacterium]